MSVDVWPPRAGQLGHDAGGWLPRGVKPGGCARGCHQSTVTVLKIHTSLRREVAEWKPPKTSTCVLSTSAAEWRQRAIGAAESPSRMWTHSISRPILSMNMSLFGCAGLP